MEEIKHSDESTFRGCGCGCGCPPENKDFNKDSSKSDSKQIGNKCECICTGNHSDNHFSDARSGK